MKKSLNLSGLSGKNYDLEQLSDQRLKKENKLIIQVHEYKEGESSNPTDIEVGQIWLSRKVK